jgi:hypothetical protein
VFVAIRDELPGGALDGEPQFLDRVPVTRTSSRAESMRCSIT